MENLQEPSHVLRVGRVVVVGLDLFINTSDIIFRNPISLGLEEKENGWFRILSRAGANL